jgi:hypothetical protein
MSFIFGLIIGIVFTYILELILQSNKKLRQEFWEHHKPIFGYHFHHSVFGIPLIIVGLYFIYNPVFNGLFLIGIGLGIIVWHNYTARHFIFIEKSNKERGNRQAR